MLHLFGCLYYLYQWCTVKQIWDNEIYLLIKYIKSVFWRVAKCLSYIEEARCLKVNIFTYFSSVHVSGMHVPIIGRKLLYLCDTGFCHSLWVASGLLVGLTIQPADQKPRIQSDKHQCRIDTVIFSRWWAHGCPKHVEKRNKYIKQNVHLFGLICKIIQR